MITSHARVCARTTVSVAVLLSCAVPAGALTTATVVGGASATPAAAVRSITCRSACTGRAAAQEGGLLRLRGRNMARAAAVVFLGRRGRTDDRAAPAVRPESTHVDVRVPSGAATGPVRVVAADGTPSPPSPEPVVIGDGPSPLSVPGASGAADPAGAVVDVFPIRGRHGVSGGPAGRFGAGRAGHTHQGQDVFASCGTPLVAARGGRVKFKAFQSLAGNYLVIATPTGEDMAYMHLKAPALVSKGDRVAAGDPIGEVGDTGDARGCHLHFELWTAPGWYSGGHPVDPLAFLRKLDRRR